MNSKLVYTILILALSSCSLQKRLYNKGFYTNKPTSIKKSFSQPNNINADLIANNSKTKNIKLNFTQTLSTDTCDTIFTKKGEKISVKNIKIYAEEVKFKMCQETKNIIYILRNFEIEKIHYASGTTT